VRAIRGKSERERTEMPLPQLLKKERPPLVFCERSGQEETNRDPPH